MFKNTYFLVEWENPAVFFFNFWVYKTLHGGTVFPVPFGEQQAHSIIDPLTILQ